MAARTKAWVCGCSLVGIVGSNSAGGMEFCCGCCVFSGRGLCGWLVTRPEESYRVWGVCDREASTLCRPWPTGGCRAIKNTVTLRLCGFKVRFILQLISYVKLFRRRLYPKGNDNFFLFYFLKKFLNFLRSEFSNPANCTIYYCLGKIYVRGIIHKFEIMHLK